MYIVKRLAVAMAASGAVAVAVAGLTKRFFKCIQKADLCEAGGCLDAKGLGGCLGPKHPPAGGCLAE